MPLFEELKQYNSKLNKFYFQSTALLKVITRTSVYTCVYKVGKSSKRWHKVDSKVIKFCYITMEPSQIWTRQLASLYWKKPKMMTNQSIKVILSKKKKFQGTWILPMLNGIKAQKKLYGKTGSLDQRLRKYSMVRGKKKWSNSRMKFRQPDRWTAIG